ncbi:hypothetical protein DXG03_000180 [Asterophora parasitica]|uniref:beta-glucosidase n=1 Tax=Asterophora parasitica TaxID=117018 RepID=A0A9P7GF60_9AGAR|nr:hypothetical protein DXG03_000180 [Asterophora parasitica]
MFYSEFWHSKRMEDSPSYPSFGDQGQEYGKILYNEVSGTHHKVITMSTTLPQGIFVGYRGFEVRNLVPLFPFGFGLSYTKFEYSGIEASAISPEGKFTVSFDVKNIGDVEGREVAQIYVTDLVSSLPRPAKELKGFVKVNLNPGEIKRVEHTLDRDALSFYDDRGAHWIAEAGKFSVLVGASSVDIRLTKEVELAQEIAWTGL